MPVLSRKIFQTPFAVIDAETTGLDPTRDRIVELAIVILKPGQSKPVASLDTLIDPERSISNTRYHGINDEDVANAPTFRSVASIVVAGLSNRVLVAHNARFDVAFLRHELERAHYPAELPYLCTLELDKLTTPEPELSYSRSLRSLTTRYGLPDFHEHRAREDALASAFLLRHHLRELRKRGVTTFAELRQQSPVEFEFADSLEEHVAVPPLELGDPRLLRPRERNAPQRVSALAEYLDAVLVALADLEVEQDELAQVRQRQRDLELSPAEIRVVHARVYQSILDRYSEDRLIDLREMRNLHDAARGLRTLGWCPGDDEMNMLTEPEPQVRLPAPDATPEFPDELLEKVFCKFLEDDPPDTAAMTERIEHFLEDLRRNPPREEFDLQIAESIGHALTELAEHVGQGTIPHRRLVYAAVGYFVSDDDVVADSEVGGFDDDVQVLNTVCDHFFRPDLRVELDFGY